MCKQVHKIATMHTSMSKATIIAYDQQTRSKTILYMKLLIKTCHKH